MEAVQNPNSQVYMLGRLLEPTSVASSNCYRHQRSVPTPFSYIPFSMMKHFHIRSFHASHQLNLQPMDDEREYLPWMSDPFTYSVL